MYQIPASSALDSQTLESFWLQQQKQKVATIGDLFRTELRFR
jgi:hypothetical protein